MSLILPTNKLVSNYTKEELRALQIKQLDRQKQITLGEYQVGKVRDWDSFKRSSGLELVEPPIASISAKLIKQIFDQKKQRILDGLEDKVEEEKKDDNELIISKKENIIDDEFSVIESLRNNPKVKYFKQQEKHAASIIRHFIKHKQRARALSAGVGTGKTYMLGAVIVELWRREFPALVNSISPFPCLYVTRASIVEQTERVLFNQFNLRPGHHVTVTNIDQLRATLGDTIINERIEIVYGVEHTIYTWYDMLAPGLIILDEAHAVKNVDSEQSKRMQAFNDLQGEHYSIYSSATLWTRVIESKCFAVATKLNW